MLVGPDFSVIAILLHYIILDAIDPFLESSVLD